MDARPITDADEALIEEATAVLADHFRPGRHEVASALRTDSGRTYAAINLVPSVGTAGIHCEPITIANAIRDGETGFDATVAVTYEDRDPARDVRVISACGVCRELVRDFDPGTDILFRDGDRVVKATAVELLPAKG